MLFISPPFGGAAAGRAPVLLLLPPLYTFLPHTSIKGQAKQAETRPDATVYLFSDVYVIILKSQEGGVG
jgi:hypothetical protein